MPSGRVLELWRWPVKSMAGERLGGLALDARGVKGDRAHAVLREHKGRIVPLTAREAPRLLAWHAGYDGYAANGHEPPMARLTAPDGRRFGWEEAALPRALADDLGRPVQLQRDLGGIQDLRNSVLVTFEASRAALARELEMEIDLRRFRPNLHLALDAAAWAEEDWTGRTLRFSGGLALELLHPCERCAIPTRDPDTQAKWPDLLRHLDARHATLFGINARVLGPARVTADETVTLV
jgi:uncharacterized protein YcbX